MTKKIVNIYYMPTNLSQQMQKKSNKKAKKKPTLNDVFFKTKTHMMPNGDIHTGSRHTKNSRLVKKAKPKKKIKKKTNTYGKR